MSKTDSITSLTISGSAVWLLWLPKQMSGASIWSFWSTCQSITGNLGQDKNTLLNPGSGDRGMQTMHHQMDGAFFCTLPTRETSFFLPWRAYRNTVSTGSWAVEIMDFFTMKMPSSLLIKTAHLHTPIWRPLFHCQLPSGLQSHRQFPISYPWPMGQKTQAHSQVGVLREPCFSACQLTRPGNIAENGEPSECTVGGEDSKGSWEQTAGRFTS